MTGAESRAPLPQDAAGVVNGLQKQIDDILDVLAGHQRVFEAMRAAGFLPADGDGEEP